MLWNAKNGTVAIGGSEMEYVAFGTGRRALVMLPGLGDGLQTVHGMAAMFAVLYRAYGKDFRVYVFSRKNRLGAGYSTREMARDQAEAMGKLGMEKACVLGISQGGMIAQHFAIAFPERVERLVLAVTLSRPNETVRAVLGGWSAMARAGDYRGLLIDTAEKSYSERYLKKYRMLHPVLGRVGRPRSFDRFLVQARACMEHDAYAGLSGITCPTLVIGGGRDQIVGAEAAAEIAGQIAGSELVVYEDLGHGAYEEAEDFPARVLQFLKK